MSSLIKQALDQIEEVKNKEGGVSGVPSGFQRFGQSYIRVAKI